MIKIGQQVILSAESQEDGKKREKVQVAVTCVYIHPKRRFAVFDFGWCRESFTEAQLNDMGIQL